MTSEQRSEMMKKWWAARQKRQTKELIEINKKLGFNIVLIGNILAVTTLTNEEIACGSKSAEK